MAINLYGNVSGTYQKPNIDLFEMARKQNNQPVKFCDTEAGKNLPAIKVNISEEGLRALHGSKMKGSVDIQKQMEEMQYISEHQPVESFTNRLSRVMQNSYVQFSESNSDEKLTIQKKADVLLGEFKSICDECFLQAFFGQSCKTFLDIVACPNWTKLQSVGQPT